MATEAPGLSPRDWSITLQEDGTLRLTRTASWKAVAFARMLLLRLKAAAILAGLVWAIFQLPSGVRWIGWLAFLPAASFLVLPLVAFSLNFPQWLSMSREWVLGTDFFEVRSHSRRGPRIESFQACTVQLVEQAYARMETMWHLQLDGEAAREHSLPEEIRNRLSYSVGYVLGITARPDDVEELRALGELIARHTGWPFSVHQMPPVGDADP